MFRQSVEKKLATKIQQHDSIIEYIELDNSPYNARGWIHIHIKPGTNAESFRALESQLNAISNDVDVMGAVILSVTATKARAVVDMLFQTNQINLVDRLSLEDNVCLAEQNQNYFDKITNHYPSSPQSDFIKQFLAPHLEHIISLSNDHRKVFTLLTYAFSRYFDEIYIEKEVYECIKSFGAMKSLLVIAKVCNGTADLESTYIRLGTHIPSIEKQREEVADNILKMFYEKFNNLSTLDRFYYAAEMIMMTSRAQQNIYPAHTKQFLDSALAGKISGRDAFFSFVPLGGISNVVFKAIIKAKLTNETQNLKDAIKSNIATNIIDDLFTSPSEDLATDNGISIGVRR